MLTWTTYVQHIPFLKNVFSLVKLSTRMETALRLGFDFTTTHVGLFGIFLKHLFILTQGLFFVLLRDIWHSFHLNSLHVFAYFYYSRSGLFYKYFFRCELCVPHFRYILFFLIASEIDWKHNEVSLPWPFLSCALQVLGLLMSVSVIYLLGWSCSDLQ